MSDSEKNEGHRFSFRNREQTKRQMYVPPNFNHNKKSTHRNYEYDSISDSSEPEPMNHTNLNINAFEILNQEALLLPSKRPADSEV